MTIIVAAKQVVDTGTCHAIRFRKDQMPRGEKPIEYDVKQWDVGNKKKGWFLLDLFTASAICAVVKACSPEQVEKLDRLPAIKLAEFCMKVVSARS